MEDFTEVRAQERYRDLVEDTKRRIGYADSIAEGYDPFEDVNNHGADTGWPGFTYTSECSEFFDAHVEAIYELLQEDADALGYRNVPEFISTFARAGMANTPDGYKNLLAWYALETVAMRETQS